MRIIAPADAQAILLQAGISDVQIVALEGVRFFDAPHEVIRSMSEVDAPQEYGIHYLELLSHPGDSQSFQETMPVLARPVSAPWSSTVNAVRIALALKPKYM